MASSVSGFQEAATQDVPTAMYRIALLETAPPRFAVRATLPSSGSLLSMATSWSLDVPEVAEAGCDADGSLVGALRYENVAVREPALPFVVGAVFFALVG